MKKKSTSRFAFFNLRVLIGVPVVLAGAVLALISLGTFSGLTATSAQAQQNHKIINVPGLPPGFDCAQISPLGIDKQENFRAGAIMIACGESQGGSALPYGSFAQLFHQVTAPLVYGGADVDLIGGEAPAVGPSGEVRGIAHVGAPRLLRHRAPAQVVVERRQGRAPRRGLDGCGHRGTIFASGGSGPARRLGQLTLTRVPIGVY